jgi:hypothetical protein
VAQSSQQLCFALKRAAELRAVEESLFERYRNAKALIDRGLI